MSADGKHILLVEDDPGLRDLIVSQFGDHSILCAAHRRAAYEALEAGRFDLVLLDLQLPVDERDISPNREIGFEILQTIRAQSRLDDAAVVVMTAHEGTSETTKRALLSGATEYWNKDGSYRESLFSVVTRVLQQQGERRQQAIAAMAARRHRLDFSGGDRRAVLDGSVVFIGREYELLDVLREIRVGATDGSHPFLRLAPLADRLSVDQEYARKLVQRIRRRVETHYAAEGGATPDRDAVIEHQGWQGYRLSPTRVEIADLR